MYVGMYVCIVGMYVCINSESIYRCVNGESLTYNDEYWVLSSCIALLAGVAQSVGAPLLGFIMNFVPHPVICGFTSAGGLIIAMSQVKSIVGFKIRKENLQWGCAASVFVLFAPV